MKCNAFQLVHVRAVAKEQMRPVLKMPKYCSITIPMQSTDFWLCDVVPKLSKAIDIFIPSRHYSPRSATSLLHAQCCIRTGRGMNEPLASVRRCAVLPAVAMCCLRSGERE